MELAGFPAVRVAPSLYTTSSFGERSDTAVLVRDRSIPMTMFAGTVEASANNWKFRNKAGTVMNVGEFTKFTETDYLRAKPAPSDYLATAVAPAPWPTRTGPKVSVGRLPPGKERTGTGPPIRR